MRAAIAIGSNSTRLLAAEKSQGKLENIYRGREETRLFLGLNDQGMIAPEKLEETAQAVARLAAQARELGAQTVDLFATSATRDAANGQALAHRISQLCGLDLKIISGEEEARLAFIAAAGEERRLVMDIGGGSTEFTMGERGIIQWALSAQMGASRLLKQFPIQCREDALRARDAALDVLKQALKNRPMENTPPIIGLGGSCTTAAAIQMGYEAHGEMVEGQAVSLTEAERQLTLLSSLSLEERMQVPGLPAARALHMPHGLCILTAAMMLLGQDRITVSGKTNLDGYLLSQPPSVHAKASQ